MTFNQGHALVIGVGSYTQAQHMDVPITVSDAAAVAAVLVDPARCGYPPAQVQVLHDATATRAGMLAALDRLATQTQPSDTVLIFYAGHGAYGTDGRYYLTSSDTRIANSKVVAGTGVSDQELVERLAKLRAERVLVICNACHAGALGGSLSLDGNATTLPPTTAAAILGTGQGRIVITACRAEQKSYFDLGASTTIFTEALVRGLQGQGVMNRNGGITVFDLYSTVYDTVRAAVDQRYRKPQQPELTIRQGVGALVVALYPGATAVTLDAVPQAAPQGKAVRTVAEAEVQQALQQIISGNENIGAGRDITGNTFVRGRQVNTGGGQYVERDQINLGSGDYVKGNQTKSSGNVSISGGTVHGPVVGNNSGMITMGGTAAERPNPFAEVYRRIAARPDDPNVDSDELTTLVRQIEAEASKGATANTTKLERWLNTLGALAPNVLAETTAALVHPALGTAHTVRTLAERFQTR